MEFNQIMKKIHVNFPFHVIYVDCWKEVIELGIPCEMFHNCQVDNHTVGLYYIKSHIHQL
jgi:hypothetical protein